MKKDENIFLSDGRAMRDEREELMVARIGKVYYLSDGTVVLARTKKNWAEKIIRVMYADALGQRKGFRDLAACMILDKGDRKWDMIQHAKAAKQQQLSSASIVL